MYSHDWQLPHDIDAVVFDCDGTLSAIEGVDELAKMNGVGAEVNQLTTKAMGQTGLNPTLYSERLQLINPNAQQVQQLGETYFKNRVPDVEGVINLLQRLNKKVYLLSAGLSPAVKLFGKKLQIPESQIFSVDILFDPQGKYHDFDHDSPLIHNEGKRLIVSELKKLHSNIIHIGDGLNDIVTRDIVTRFIGYGGIFYRQNIEKFCQFYLYSESLTPLLPLSLTANETQLLQAHEKQFYDQGLGYIQNGKVKVRHS